MQARSSSKDIDNQTLTIGAGLIEYRLITRKSSKLAMVFLHEGLGSVALWKNFPDRVAEETGCNVFAYSRFGYGNSDPVALPRQLSYMQDEALHNLGPILDQMGVADCVLLGHSDGASIATVYCGSTRDSRIKGLVLMSPHFFVEDLSLRSIRQAKLEFESGDLRKKLEPYHGSNVDCAFWGWNTAWLDPEFKQWNIEHYLSTVSVPVLAIQGLNDQYGTAKQLQSLRQNITTALDIVTLPDCGHSPHRDQADATLQAVSKFMKTISTVLESDETGEIPIRHTVNPATCRARSEDFDPELP
jgi:pimeloyl-ACP methyl ester carboxylesterase